MTGSSRDTVYETIRSRLMTQHYAADVALIPQSLSAEFGVSRTPVREALGLLERDGLLVSTKRGFAIRSRTPEEVLELFEVRAVLDSAAAAAAAARRSPVDLATFDAAVRGARAETDPAAIRRRLNDWHDAVRRAAHNRAIADLLHTLDAQVKVSAPWRTPPGGDVFEPSHAAHEAISAAIRDGNADGARTRMLEHLSEDRDSRIQQLLDGARGAQG